MNRPPDKDKSRSQHLPVPLQHLQTALPQLLCGAAIEEIGEFPAAPMKPEVFRQLPETAVTETAVRSGSMIVQTQIIVDPDEFRPRVRKHPVNRFQIRISPGFPLRAEIARAGISVDIHKQFASERFRPFPVLGGMSEGAQNIDSRMVTGGLQSRNTLFQNTGPDSHFLQRRRDMNITGQQRHFIKRLKPVQPGQET